MPPRNNATGRLHIALAASLLVVVAVAMAATFPPADLAARWNRLARSFAGDRAPLAQGTGFWFDRNYAPFLDEVGRRTPVTSTVAVIAPGWPDVYTYQAVYQLAPRRVVDSRRAAEADYVAAYRIDAAGAPGAVAIPYGTLSRSRR
jgi:hypothetical protein